MNEDILNRHDVAILANKPNVETKSAIASKIGSYYRKSKLSSQEIQIAEDIFRIMVRDTEFKVREVISNNLKDCKHLPKDIVDSILNDIDSVAIPFIQYYEMLSDEDLIRILNTTNIERQKAVSQRKNLSSELSNYITENCNDEVIGELISNESANIQENSFNIILDKYSDNDDIKKRMVFRSELPVSIIEKIVGKISYKLKSHLVLRHNLPKDLASNLVEEIKEKIILHISEEHSSDSQIEELVHQLYKANRLTPNLVVRAICLGDLKFFEYALVYLSELPIAEVRKILFSNQADFMIRNLLRKAFIPKSVFPAIFSALKIIKEIRFDCGRFSSKAFGHKVVERILSLLQNNDELTPEDIKYLVSKIN